MDSLYLRIDHNTFDDNIYAGVMSANRADIDVSDNRFLSSSYALYLDGSGGVRVESNTMEDGSYGIRAFDVVNLAVMNNDIDSGLGGVHGGFGSGTTILGNRFEKTPGNYGSIICSSGTPVIRNNTFRGGNALYVQDSGTPDAGTVASPGHNNFSGITGVVLQHTGTGVVQAVGNNWPHDPPQLGVDYTVTGGGTVVTH